MKIGFCGGAEKLKKVTADVADYIEVNLTSISKKTEGEIRELLSISQNAGVPIETANCFFPPEIKLCGMEYSKKSVEEYSKSALYKGAQLGLEVAVVGSGRSRIINEYEDADSCYKQLEESFYAVADIAKQYDITIVVEPLSKGDTNSINTVAEGADFVKRVNHTNLYLLADVYHIVAEREPYQSIVDNGSLLRHVHIARGETRKFPTADDGFDYNAVKEALKKAGYNSRISIEGGPYEDFDSEIAGSVKFLKSVFC